MTTTVADVLVDGLARAGAARVFGTATDPNADLYLAAARRRGLETLSIPAAGDACVMAAVSGGLAGVPGAAVIGGDVPDSVPALAHASTRRWPLVAVTLGASRGREELAPFVKATVHADAGSAAHWIAHACRLSVTEPWGPVCLDLGSTPADAAAVPVATWARATPPAPPPAGDLDEAARCLGAAERPLLVVGRFCRAQGDAAWVRAFAEARPAPVVVTLAARGVLPDPHPLVVTTLDGSDVERRLFTLADLVVAVGLDPLEMREHPWPPGVPTLHLSPVDHEFHGRTLAVTGDIGLILEELAPRLRDQRLAEWDVAMLHGLKQRVTAPPADVGARIAHRVVRAARELTPPHTVAVFDPGAVWATAMAAWLTVAPGDLLTSDEAGRLALAVAAGAHIARPRDRVVCFTRTEALTAPDREAVVARVHVRAPIVAIGPAAPRAGSSPGTVTAATPSTFAMAFEAALGSPAPTLIAVLADERAAASRPH